MQDAAPERAHPQPPAPQDRLRLMLAQMRSTTTHAGNVATLGPLARRAAAEGCAMLCLPEVAGLMNRDAAEARAQVVEEARDPWLAACREAAARHGLWLHAGSSPVLSADGRFLNRAWMVDPGGEVVARYDKIHLFDVYLGDGEARLESARFAPGAEAVLAPTPWGPLGMTICYDLRFPHLYRTLAKAGARLIFAPAAFTAPTGRAHWEVLIRARAIENGAFMLCPAQTGRHDDGRETWGHALAVDPWGAVLADLGFEEGAAVVEIDLADSETARAKVPSLANERDFAGPLPGQSHVATPSSSAAASAIARR